ncbi:hypothetical protein P171DRAFT_443273 [Karstenula rhodostoma CBS 690.94]|uniref:Uncharacterized protein n=1 Tax=Karstenula rhodostoma CBS 690.94 TaxID=1392251 RepID=A0A9P4UBI8_9PLEO|nr:hypothetical protein P171DRAFT_443273 [Karstenula rhodostoma CBS 690.94]
MVFLWLCAIYFAFIACVASAPTPSDQNKLKFFGCLSIVITAHFDHRPAFAMAAMLGYILYNAWNKAQHSDSAAMGYPNGFSVSNDIHWDDEDDADDADVALEVVHAQDHQVNLGDLLKKVQEMDKSNETLLATIDRIAEECDELKAEKERLAGKNFDLNCRVNLYENSSILQKQIEKTEETKQLMADLIAETGTEISELKGKLAHSETVINEYRKLQGEAGEREKKKDEQIESFHRTDQSTEAKLRSLEIIIKTLHGLAEKGGPITEAAVYVMNELVRSNIPVDHLQIDLGKFAYYVQYVRLQWSQRGMMVGGFRATMSMYLGGNARNNLVFIHNDRTEEVMPPKSVNNRYDFEHACNELEVWYSCSTDTGFSGSMVNTGFSGLMVTTCTPSAIQPSFAGPGPTSSTGSSLSPLPGSNSGGLTLNGATTATGAQQGTNYVTTAPKVIRGGGNGTLGQIIKDAKKKKNAPKEDASSSDSITKRAKRSSSPDQGISIKGAAAPKKNPFEDALKEIAQKKLQAAVPASKPFANNPFDKNMNKANALPQNRGVNLGSSWSATSTLSSVPFPNLNGSSNAFVPHSSSRAYRGLARDGDSIDML